MASKAIKMKDIQGNNIYPCAYYPVGSIYLSINEINPTNFFGGEWEQISGRFLLGAGKISSDNTNPNLGQIREHERNWVFHSGETGGEFSHLLSVAEMPSHNHINYAARWMNLGYQGNGGLWGYSADSWDNPQLLKPAGGSETHNNMPPYFVVYIWCRIA